MTKKRQSKLDKNMNALKAIKSDILTWFDEQSSIDWIQQIRSENGDKNLLIQSGGKFINAYPMDDPTKSADDATERMNLYKENLSIVIGFGLGYLCKSILKKMEKGHRVIIVEPIADIIKLAFSNFDFSDELKTGKLILLPGKDELIFTLHFLSNQFVISDYLVTTEKYTRDRFDEYGKIITTTNETINQIMSNTGTIAGIAGGIIADNDVSCLPYVIRHRGVNELKDLFKDKPAILVSTGPSLAKNIHHLIDNQDKAIIICVGQAIRILLAYGIRPDFATTVDFGDINMCHFQGLMNCDIPLVTINRTYAPLIKEWAGPKFIAATPVPGYEHMATGILTEKGFIEAGGSVAHLSFGLALLLGCSPITFVGQDLALSDGQSHIKLSDAGGNIEVNERGGIDWIVDDPRCRLSKNKEKHSMGKAFMIDGYYGSPVLTYAGYASYLTVFENMVFRYNEENEEVNETN